MSDIVLSIRPRHLGNILAGTKTIELRRKVPARPVEQAWLYETRPRSEIVAIAGVTPVGGGFSGYDDQGLHPGYPPARFWHNWGHQCGVTADEFFEYFKGAPLAYGFRIDWVTEERPMPITELGLKRAPQSWCYAPELGDR